MLVGLEMPAGGIPVTLCICAASHKEQELIPPYTNVASW